MTANKNYRVDSFVTGLAIKAPCKAVAIANITLSGEQTVNGVAVVAGDRVLVTAQTSSVDNGIYNVESSAWQRTGDFDGNRDVADGTLVLLETGIGELVIYQVTSSNPITIGSSAITFSLVDKANITYPVSDLEIAAGASPTDLDEPWGTPERFGAADSYSAGTDDTTFVQAAFDVEGETVTFRRMYEYTYAEPSEGVTVQGKGNGTGLIRKGGIQFYTQAGGNTGSYALRPKSGISRCAFKDFELDGNAGASLDSIANYEELLSDSGQHDGSDNASVLTDSGEAWTVNEHVGSTIKNMTDSSSATVISNTATTVTATLSGGTDNDWDTNDYYVIDTNGITQGRIKEAGLAMTELADGSYTPPEFIFIDNIYSHDHIRNNFIFQAGSNPIVGSIVSENSDIDHGVYSDVGDIGQFGNVYIKGHYHSGAIVSSGSQFGNVFFEDLTLNPNTMLSYDANMTSLIDDRSDTRGSQFGNIQVVGNLATIDDSASPVREIIRARGFGLHVNSLKIDCTDAADFALDIISVRATPAAPGNVRGTVIDSINAEGLPDSAIMAALDSDAHGVTITGFKIGQFNLKYRSGAAISANALVHSAASKLENIDIGSGYVIAADFAEGGPKQLFDCDVTTSVLGCRFHDIRMDDADITEEPWDLDSTATLQNISFDRIITRNAGPTGDNRTYAKVSDCRFHGSLRLDPLDTVIDITTTDATVTTAFDYNAFQGHDLTDDSVFLFVVTAAARKSDGSERGGFILNELWYRDGGGATKEPDDTARSFVSKSLAALDVTFAADTNNLLIQVTGAAATTINWRLHITAIILPNV